MNPTFDHAVRPLTEREFRRFQRLIHRESGIHLSESKKALVVGRLTRRLRTLGLRDFSSYLDRVVSASDQYRTAVSSNGPRCIWPTTAVAVRSRMPAVSRAFIAYGVW